MAKTKTPFLSLGSRGTVGNALTTQKQGNATMVRTKPTPTDPLTLPQQYQRWLYQDYAYLWTKQSEATKREHAVSGARFHLTGFQHWMKYNLTDLPDIMAWYRMDAVSAGATLDHSRNLNHATVFGASVNAGRIDQALHFDGLNDRLEAPDSPIYSVTAALSVEFFLRLHVLGQNKYVVAKFRSPPGIVYFLYSLSATNFLRFYVGNALSVNAAITIAALQQDRWYHVLGFHDGVNTRLFLDSIPQLDAATPVPPVVNTEPLDIGVYNGDDRWLFGDLDNIIIRNRAPDTTEITRWSARRYPPE